MSYDLTSFEKAMALFANRVGIIVNLEVGDKRSPEQAYKEIKQEYCTAYKPTLSMRPHCKLLSAYGRLPSQLQ